jgi:tetratricopeptide (TPR) repeat protein
MIPSAFEAFRSAAHAKAFPQNMVDNAHDWPLQLAVGSGLPGALLGVGVWTMALAGTARKALSPDPSRDTWVLSGIWLGLAGYAIYLLSAVATTGSQALAWILVGALVGYAAEEREVGPVRAAAVVPWVAGVLCVALVAWTLALVVADNRYLRHRAQMRGDAPGDPLASAKAALALSPLDAHYRAAVAQAYFARASAQTDKAAAEADYNASLAAYASAIEADPGDWWVAMSYAEVLRAGGRSEQAAQLLQQAREAAPMNPYLKAVK